MLVVSTLYPCASLSSDSFNISLSVYLVKSDLLRKKINFVTRQAFKHDFLDFCKEMIFSRSPV